MLCDRQSFFYNRVLEAVAKDVMFGPLLSFVSKGTINDNPVVAVIITWVLVECFLLMGSVNSIAQLSSVLFLVRERKRIQS